MRGLNDIKSGKNSINKAANNMEILENKVPWETKFEENTVLEKDRS